MAFRKRVLFPSSSITASGLIPAATHAKNLNKFNILLLPPFLALKYIGSDILLYFEQHGAFGAGTFLNGGPKTVVFTCGSSAAEQV